MKKVCFVAAIALVAGACSGGVTGGSGQPAIPSTSKDRSVIVVRVFHDNVGCNNGAKVRLARVVDGRVDTGRAILVGHDIVFTTSGRLKPGTTIGRSSPEATSAAYRELQLDNMRKSFAAIPPGDYQVMHVQCTYRNGVGNGTTTVDIGGGNRTDWAPSGAGASVPVLGANFIHIPADRVVDTGVLFIRTTEAGGFLSNGKGVLEGRAVGAPAQASLRQEFPGVYAKAVFSAFTKTPGAPH